jgi:HD-GYP domain-containing protein (c-di-GMP phosphodiesterase class II)
VADAFDAMTSNRPYRVAMSIDRAFQELIAHAGRHFDPVAVRSFLGLRPQIESRMNREAPAQIVISTEPLATVP